MSAAPSEADIRGMVAEMLQTAREEGRREALETTKSTLLALRAQAAATGRKFINDANVGKYTAGQEASLQSALGWVQAELGEEAEE